MKPHEAAVVAFVVFVIVSIVILEFGQPIEWTFDGAHHVLVLK